MERWDRKDCVERIQKAHEQMIKVMEEQTEMLKSLITLQSEQMRACPPLQLNQNYCPCPTENSSTHSFELYRTSRYPVHSIPSDSFQTDSWTHTGL